MLGVNTRPVLLHFLCLNHFQFLTLSNWFDLSDASPSMMKTKMEGRVDVIERNLGSIEELLATMKMDQEKKLALMEAEQDQKFARLESLSTSLVRGKGITKEGDTLNITP